MSVLDRHSVPTYASAAKGHGKPHASLASATPPEDPHPSVLKVKKLKQAISKAERSVTLFDLDLGSVPVLNRDTLSKKVTLVLHERAQTEGVYEVTLLLLKKLSTTSYPAPPSTY
jgi:hypothetical protein